MVVISLRDARTSTVNVTLNVEYILFLPPVEVEGRRVSKEKKLDDVMKSFTTTSVEERNLNVGLCRSLAV